MNAKSEKEDAKKGMSWIDEHLVGISQPLLLMDQTVDETMTKRAGRNRSQNWTSPNKPIDEVNEKKSEMIKDAIHPQTKKPTKQDW